MGIGNPSLYTTSSSRARKRKILKEKFSFGGDQSPQSAQKRRSSVSDVTRLSEDSFLDYTFGSTITNDGKYNGKLKVLLVELFFPII